LGVASAAGALASIAVAKIQQLSTVGVTVKLCDPVADPVFPLLASATLVCDTPV